MINKINRYYFMFEELVKRDFKKKYKRTVLGMGWSVLSPILQLVVMAVVFTQFFGRTTPHYIIYLFAGNLIFSYFRESTNAGMGSLVANTGIISKINLPKYIFLLSRNTASFINFALTLVVFLLFAFCDGITFSWHLFLLIFPIGCVLIFNIGVGLVLSALFVFFKDIQYLYDVFTMLLMYVSAIFYTVDTYSATVQRLFHLNPIYVYIKYVRTLVIDGRIPSLEYHGLCLFYAFFVLLVGALIYKKQNYKFIYYM